ncbi:MAG: glycosyltransferase [Deltaproteobacteria bacterium]|nr:glycosyltransferase [Deltaproteobacteria bacterium]
MRVLLFIGHLDQGGSQRQMAELARGLAADGHQVCMVTILARGQFEALLEGQSGLEVVSLFSEKAPSFWGTAGQLISSVRRLRRCAERFRPDVVYSTLYISNLVAYLALRREAVPLVWGIRSSNEVLTWKRSLALAVGRRLASRLPAVVYNSRAGSEWHEKRGFPSAQSRVIPNGIDTESFQKDPLARARCRASWGIDDQEFLVGLVARLSPMKDHQTFLEAVGIVARQRPEIRFVCVGDGPAATLEGLQRQAQRLGVQKQLLWTGRETDMVATYNALDLLVSSSAWGEGFSNALGEGMACCVPCVATDAGDARDILGDTGVLVPPGSATELAAGILLLKDELPKQRQQRSEEARRQIVENFSVPRMIHETAQLLRRVTPQGAAKDSRGGDRGCSSSS